MVHQRAEVRARLGQFGWNPVHIGVALVADHQAPLGIHHDEPVRQTRQRHIETYVLPAQIFFALLQHLVPPPKIEFRLAGPLGGDVRCNVCNDHDQAGGARHDDGERGAADVRYRLGKRRVRGNRKGSHSREDESRRWQRPAGPKRPKAPIDASTRAERSARRSTMPQPATFTSIATGTLRCSVAGTSSDFMPTTWVSTMPRPITAPPAAACHRPSGAASAKPVVVNMVATRSAAATARRL